MSNPEEACCKSKRFDLPPAARWLMLGAWMVAIFCFSAQPNSAALTEHLFGSFNWQARKAAHVTEYAILYALARNAFRRGGLVEFVFCVLYACSDEFHQSFVPGRSASLWDVGIDSIGMMLCWLSIYGYQRWLPAGRR